MSIKEVLSILIGILGILIGVYVGLLVVTAAAPCPQNISMIMVFG